MIRVIVLAIALSCVWLPHSAQAELRVTAGIKNNPAIYFSGVSGNQRLTTEIDSILRACGWFDVADSDKSTYRLDAQQSGGRVILRLSSGGAPVSSWGIQAADPRMAAKAGVDAILFKLFNIKGLCMSRIAFCADTAKGVKNIYVCDIDGKNVEQITNFNSLCVEPCWFPDGNSIGYTQYGKMNTNIVQTQLAPKRSRVLCSLPGLNTGVTVSPDRRKLAMILSPDYTVDLYVRNTEGGPLRRLTKGKSVEASPCWSPDSRKICFVSDETGAPRLYMADIVSGTKMRLPSAGTEAVTPDWSQDDKIVYATRIAGVYTLAVLDLKTKENTRATMVPGTWESPAWAADNRQVVCKRSDGGRSSLFVVDTWTGKARQLLRTANALSMPSWSRAGR